MTKETFNEIVWRLVSQERMTTTVIDNHHAYGIISDRVASFWEQVRLLNPGDDQEIILGSLIAISAFAQICAEQLGLIDEQHGVDQTRKNMEKDNEEVLLLLESLVSSMSTGKKPAERLQRDTPRYSFEFNGDLVKSLNERIKELK